MAKKTTIVAEKTITVRKQEVKPKRTFKEKLIRGACILGAPATAGLSLYVMGRQDEKFKSETELAQAAIEAEERVNQQQAEEAKKAVAKKKTSKSQAKKPTAKKTAATTAKTTK